MKEKERWQWDQEDIHRIRDEREGKMRWSVCFFVCFFCCFLLLLYCCCFSVVVVVVLFYFCFLLFFFVLCCCCCFLFCFVLFCLLCCFVLFCLFVVVVVFIVGGNPNDGKGNVDKEYNKMKMPKFTMIVSIFNMQSSGPLDSLSGDFQRERGMRNHFYPFCWVCERQKVQRCIVSIGPINLHYSLPNTSTINLCCQGIVTASLKDNRKLGLLSSFLHASHISPSICKYLFPLSLSFK